MKQEKKQLSNEVREILDTKGFDYDEDGIPTKRGNSYYVELNQYTPEGEDWWETIWFDGTDEGFANAVREYAEGYDVDEEVELWVNIRGKNGVPSSIKDLVADAEWKRKQLQTLSADLDKLLKNETAEPEETYNEHGFNEKGFMSHLEENFDGLDNSLLRNLITNIIKYGYKHEPASKDEFCYLVSLMLSPEVAFMDVAAFMSDDHLTESGKQQKKAFWKKNGRR